MQTVMKHCCVICFNYCTGTNFVCVNTVSAHLVASFPEVAKRESQITSTLQRPLFAVPWVTDIDSLHCIWIDRLVV